MESLLLTIWNDVASHEPIASKLEHLRQSLGLQVPLCQLQLFQLQDEHRLTRVACTGDGAANGAASNLEIPGVAAWCRTGDMLETGGGGRTSPMDRSFASLHSGVALVCPLRIQDRPVGVLLVVPESRVGLVPEQRQWLEAVTLPLAVILERHLEARARDALERAVQVDQQALGQRLGGRTEDGRIVGAEGDLRPVMERIGLVGDSDLSVLLLGETGSGKEVIARAIHEGSRRCGAPFVRVNCGAIPAELIDSELFGHERGSFTGALSQRQGWFERADGGTLFLDEIGELTHAAQVRLLRVLQEGVIQRVGGHDAVPVDVRIVAATHRDLAAMVAAGSFREDLWYRVAGFPIHIPPLRHRPNDLPALAEHMAWRSAQRLGLPLVLPSAEDLRLLAAYSWPGNVRELAAVFDRAVVLGQGKQLVLASALGQALPSGSVMESRPSESNPGMPDQAFPTLEQVQRAHIEAALVRTRGRISGPTGAAALLGLNPNTLRSKMRKLKVSRAG
ncbi:sigma-54 interaction domain-containing protein [Ectothiorhodospira lacustris]|uniref:sigma-54 interaction domain-containing protein n=1 Tax=Ectothiorhodospira lacustris TaxID=2899127 RepID=UPI001EE80044|nr:sigma-54 dependent transcriptional regulator [Ectothiorhodospira lacustris]MCG5511438.1 sigma 54-interacting transcriptional regulator [Ectothiorhodospira lacustris]MCG5523224.1 sigma 54-interacting transcriptional regulator [Ectothiorhodospira lacustris]